MWYHVSGLSSFLWPNRVLLYRLTTPCLSIHPLMDRCPVSTFWPLWTVLLWTFTYKFLCPHVHLGVELPGRVAVLCLIIWETAGLFPKATAPSYGPTSTAWGFLCLHTILRNLPWAPAIPTGSALTGASQSGDVQHAVGLNLEQESSPRFTCFWFRGLHLRCPIQKVIAKTHAWLCVCVCVRACVRACVF